MQGIGVDLCDAGAEIGADEEFEALEFGLENYEAEVGFRVCVAGLVFYDLDLLVSISIAWRHS